MMPFMPLLRTAVRCEKPLSVVLQRAPRMSRPISTYPAKEVIEGAIKGVKIVDLSRVLAAPFCTQILADYGADVIKVEEVGKGDDTRYWQVTGEDDAWKPEAGPMSNYFASANRNKRSICLNLKHERGRKIFLDMVRQADVVEEQNRQDSAAKLKFCVRVLEQLGEVYASADFAFRFLRAAAEKTPARSLSGHSPALHTPTPTNSRRYDATPSATVSCGQQLYDPSIIDISEDDRIHRPAQPLTPSNPSSPQLPRPPRSSQANPSFLPSQGLTNGIHLNGDGDGAMVPHQPRDATTATATAQAWSYGLDPAIEAESRADFFAIANGLGIDIDAQLLEMTECNSILDGL